MFLIPILAGALVGAEVTQPGVVEDKINDIKSAITTNDRFVETCHVAPSVKNGDVLICLQEDGSYIVRDI